MRISVMLKNSGGVLANETVEVADDEEDRDELISLRVHDKIEAWILSPGDVIEIREL